MDQDAKNDLHKKYQARGIQQLSLDDYLAQQEKKSKKRFRLPQQVKMILFTPLILIFCCGVFLIPYFCFLVISGWSAPDKEPDTNKTSQTANPTAAVARMSRPAPDVISQIPDRLPSTVSQNAYRQEAA